MAHKEYQGTSAAYVVAEAIAGTRCVLVVDRALPPWLIANTTAVLSVALGAHGAIPLGPETVDSNGEKHPGIGAMPLPILAAASTELPELRRKAHDSGLFVVDFNTAARDSRTYPEYEHKVANEQVSYLGIAIYGAARAVTSIAGNLKSLR